MRAAVLAAALLAAAAPAFAQTEAPTPAKGPANERLADLHAPQGKTLVTIDPSKDFPVMKGLIYTQSSTIVQPGTGREMHGHKQNLELTYIVSGVLTVSRNGGPPIAYAAGQTLVNDGDTVHMWANLGKVPVQIINTNIRPGKVGGKD